MQAELEHARHLLSGGNYLQLIPILEKLRSEESLLTAEDLKQLKVLEEEIRQKQAIIHLMEKAAFAEREGRFAAASAYYSQALELENSNDFLAGKGRWLRKEADFLSAFDAAEKLRAAKKRKAAIGQYDAAAKVTTDPFLQNIALKRIHELSLNRPKRYKGLVLFLLFALLSCAALIFWPDQKPAITDSGQLSLRDTVAKKDSLPLIDTMVHDTIERDTQPAAPANEAKPPKKEPVMPSENAKKEALNRLLKEELSKQVSNWNEISGLIAKGANPDQHSRREKLDVFPLFLAIQEDNALMVEYLLKHGANPNATTFAGTPLLHYAAIYDNYTVVKLLLDYGANARTVYRGNTADGFTWAKSQKVKELIRSRF